VIKGREIRENDRGKEHLEGDERERQKEKAIV